MIYSRVTGVGTPLLLLHGYGEDHSLWDHLAHYLSQNNKVIALDLPGFGKSDPLIGEFTIDDVAAIVYHHISVELNITEYIVLGHSLGGYVALAMAEKYPNNLIGFGLINSTALSDSPEKKENRVKTAKFIRNHQAPFFLKSFVPNLFFEKNRHKFQEEIEFVISMGSTIDEKVLSDYMLAMKERPERTELLNTYKNVLFVGGQNDVGFSLSDYEIQLERLENKDNGHILKNVGHMSMYEAPDELLSVINNYLDSI